MTPFGVAITLPEIVSSGAQDFAISPDGTRVVYRGPGDLLYLLALDRLDATPLSGTDGALDFFFSPDGEWVGFQMRGNELLKVSIFGGPPQSVYLSPRAVAGESWQVGEQILTGAWSGGLVRVSTNGEAPDVLTTVSTERGELGHGWPSLIVGHEAVVFTIMSDTAGTYGEELAVLDLETREVQRLGLAGPTPRYVATGHLVYAGEDRALRAVRFDPERREVTGVPVSLADDVSINFDISTTGRLLYQAGVTSQAKRVWVGRDGEVSETIDEGFTVAPRLSPEGTRIAYQATGGIWILDLERGTNTKVVDSGLIPIWTPDGSRVTFTSDKSGRFELFSQLADGSGPAELLLDMAPNPVPGSWSPDGQALVYYQTHPDTRGDLWVLPVGGDPTPFLVTAFHEVAPRVSADGRWVAYSSNQSGEYRIYVQPFPDGGRVIPVSTGPGAEPVWSRDDHELFYRNGDEMMAVDVELGSDLAVGRPTVLFEGGYTRNTGRTFPEYDVSLDGDHFLMVAPGDPSGERSGPNKTILVFNWFQELERLVPAE